MNGELVSPSKTQGDTVEDVRLAEAPRRESDAGAEDHAAPTLCHHRNRCRGSAVTAGGGGEGRDADLGPG